ncbi:uncharacterized protein LOC135469166 [Liolophura sinensis]|uniref:uncharacterized protein LOC135469166 n=1 Tax=Liolophura sinensis TaxID=3198878 RepID=UPI0031584ACF
MQRVWLTNSALRRLCHLSSALGIKTPVPYLERHPVAASTLLHSCRQSSTMSYSAVERGSPNTLDYRIYFSGPTGFISPFHDIPLYANAEKTVLNMVVEIPRWTNHKMEISREDSLNPIKQDVKKGKLRFVKNFFPHHGYIWNYGALPQTWEDPSHEDPETKTKGDQDPLDVCEIGQKVHKRGAVIQVKVLGVMCLIDEGETDWKIIGIDVNDPLAKDVSDIEDVDKHMPGLLRATNEWFRYYKVPDGKPENKFAFDGKARNKDQALRVVNESYGFWQNLISGKADNAGISRNNTTIEGPFKKSQAEANEVVEKSAPLGAEAALPEDVNRSYYILH